MYCSNCGREVSGKFCNNCGAPLTPPAPARPYADPTIHTAPEPYADPYAAPKKSRKALLFGLLGFALLIAAAVMIIVPILKQRQITKVRQICSASVDYLIGSQKDKPITQQSWDPFAEKYVTRYEFGYDKDGCLTEEVVYSGSFIYIFKMHYNDEGVLDYCLRTVKDKDTGEKLEGGKTKYEYDSQYRLKRLTLYDENRNVQNYTEKEYEDGYLREQSVYKNNVIVQKVIFGRDDDGQLLGQTLITYSEGVEQQRVYSEFVYDDEGRLEGIAREGGRLTARYIYDD